MISVATSLWTATEAADCDGPAGRRDLFLSVDLETREIRQAILSRHGVNAVCPLPVLMIMIGGDNWAAFLRDAVKLAERRAADDEYLAFVAEEAARDRADDDNDLARAGAAE